MTGMLNERSVVHVTVSGSFRRHWAEVTDAIKSFQTLGAQVLSPRSLEQARIEDGFIYLKGEQGQPQDIERNHLDAISRSDALYVVSPDGYLGPSAALEIGYALALHVPVWSSTALGDNPHRFLVPVAPPRVVIDEIKKLAGRADLPSNDSLTGLQEYYRHASERRGFSQEKPAEVFVLLVEEIGELAKAIRSILGVSVQSEDRSRKSVRLELADCFLYLLHMANQLNINLFEAFREKEYLNSQKTWRRPKSE
jgi:NTP pyrophosphatase (non-canonical NTP hydrolase)